MPPTTKTNTQLLVRAYSTLSRLKHHIPELWGDRCLHGFVDVQISAEDIEELEETLREIDRHNILKNQP